MDSAVWAIATYTRPPHLGQFDPSPGHVDILRVDEDFVTGDVQIYCAHG